MMQNCLTHLLACVSETTRRHGLRGLRTWYEYTRIIGSPQIDIMLKKAIERLASRGVIELPPTAQISISTKPTEVVRKLYTVLNMKDLERRWNVSLKYWNKVQLFKHNFAQPTQF